MDGLTEQPDGTIPGIKNISLEELRARIFENLNPEKHLRVWYCRHCGCMCAGDGTTGMCRGCENLTPKQRGEAI